jgi:hypothetical protein
MADIVTFKEVAALAAQRAPVDQQRLVEKLLQGQLRSETEAPFDWMSVRGIAPNLLEGQDAQAWVSQMRRASEKHREMDLGRVHENR